MIKNKPDNVGAPPAPVTGAEVVPDVTAMDEGGGTQGTDSHDDCKKEINRQKERILELEAIVATVDSCRQDAIDKLETDKVSLQAQVENAVKEKKQLKRELDSSIKTKDKEIEKLKCEFNDAKNEAAKLFEEVSMLREEVQTYKDTAVANKLIIEESEEVIRRKNSACTTCTQTGEIKSHVII